MSQPKISVIISTYNAEAWLEKVLWSYEAQVFKDFEMVIADDGSRSATADLINDIKTKVSYKINHVWHEDNGFQKCIILNKAIQSCSADYILMSDGDCMAREDFLAVHFKKMEKGYFLSGGYYKLPMSISNEITKTDILNQDCFNINWLLEKGLKKHLRIIN